MEDRRQLVPNPNDALVEDPAGKPLLRGRSRFAVSTARREIHGDALHRTALPPTLQGFFFSGRVVEDHHEGDETEDEAELPPEHVLPPKRYGQFGHLLAKSAAPLVDVDPTFSFITYALPAVDYVYLLDSSNGLVLLGHLQDALNSLETCFIVCNLATKQWVEVPSCGRVDALQRRNPSVMKTYLLFDPTVSSHFHIVLFWKLAAGPGGQLTRTAQAYSSKTGEWSSERDWSTEERSGELEQWRFHIHNVHDFESPGAVVNGMLYLIHARKWILQVDAQGKTRRLMPAPGVQHQELDYHFSNIVIFIGQSQGCLHCIIQEGHDQPIQVHPALQMGPVGMDWMNHGLSIWVLQDSDAQEWILKGRVSYQQLSGKSSCDGNFQYRVAALHPDCNMILFLQHRDRKMISYDIDRQEVCTLDTDLRNSIGIITPYAPYLSELFVGVIGAHK